RAGSASLQNRVGSHSCAMAQIRHPLGIDSCASTRLRQTLDDRITEIWWRRGDLHRNNAAVVKHHQHVGECATDVDPSDRSVAACLAQSPHVSAAANNEGSN